MTDTETTTNPFLVGEYAPVESEATATDLVIEGALPADIDGRYLRIGPNPIGPVDPATHHWFVGDGMVHGLRLRAGRADWYRSRYVRSTRVSEALGEEPKPGLRHAGMDTVNTNIIGHAGKTLALVEAGARPVELTDELETVCHTDLDGTLPNGFTAHPKVDPVTGEMVAVCYFFGLPHLQVVTVGTDGRVRRVEPIPVDDGPMVHDTAITATRTMVLDLPVTFSMAAATEGATLPYRWNPDHPARVGVMPREGTAADLRWCDVDPGYVFHVLNAYDEPGTARVVMDVVRHPRVFDVHTLGPADGRPALWRWILDPETGRTDETQLADDGAEFPRVDERRVGLPARYGWMAGAHGDRPGRVSFGSSVIRYDLETGTTAIADLGPETSVGEAVVVPRDGSTTEDDAWVMHLAYDRTTDRSELVVLAADDPTGGPVARVKIPVRIPNGFHGNFVPSAR